MVSVNLLPATTAKTLRKWVLAIALVLAVVGPVRAAEKVVLGEISLSFYAVTGAVVQEVLERLGHPVEVVRGSHAEMYPKLDSGEIDLLAAAWLPNAHGPLHQPVKDKVVEVATLYPDAKLYWAVPDYVPADMVKSIDDLKRPEVAAKMDKRIVGIGPDSGVMRGAMQIAKDYGLDTAGYVIVTGPAADWIANFRKAEQEKRWVVMPLWQPQWLNRAYALRILDEPKQIYKTDTAVLVGTKAARARLPAHSWLVLSRMQLGVDAVTEMDYMVNVEKKTPREAAKAWMEKNSQQVDAWFRS